MIKAIILIIVSVLSIGITACSKADDVKINDKSTEAVTVDSSEVISYKNISPEEAKKRLESENGIVLLDVRTQEEYDEKHIPKSLLIPVDVIETEAAEKLKDKNATIFVYCRSGRRSITASEALVKMGYTKVYNLGGIIDWPYETERSK